MKKLKRAFCCAMIFIFITNIICNESTSKALSRYYEDIPTPSITPTSTPIPTLIPSESPTMTPSPTTSPTLTPTLSPTPTPTPAKTQITIQSQPTTWCNQGNIKIDFQNADGIKSITINGKIEFSASGSYLPTKKTLDVLINQASLTISVIDANNQNISETYNIHYIDRTAPSITYSVVKGILYFQASDSDSGIKEIKYSTNSYNYSTYNASGINVTSSYNTTYYAYATDTAGNQSNIIQFSYTPVTRIAFDRDSYTVVKYSSIILTPIFTPSNASDRTVTWTSSNESVAKVSNGVVTTSAEGSAVITVVSANGYRASCTIIVTGTNATNINLSEYSINMKVGDRHVVYASVSPINSINSTIIWTSSDNSVINVDNGVIYARKAGTAYVIANTTNGIRAVCLVTVTGQAATSMYLNYSRYSLDIGQKFTLTPSFYPQSASTETVTYRSSNTFIASVTSYGVVEGLNAGEAVITVISKNNLVTTCSVTVKEDLSDISLNYTSKVLYKGNFFQLKVYGTTQSATFKSSKRSVAKVDSYGNVTAVKPGKATITVTVGNKKLKCSITVKKTKKYGNVVYNDETLLRGKSNLN